VKAIRLTRRAAMAGAGVVLAGSALLPRHVVIPATAALAAPSGATFVIQGVPIALARDTLALLGVEAAPVVALEADPVRQWRSSRGAVLAARDARLVGITTWPQFLLVRGLAEESGRRVRFQHSDGHAGTITWLIS
jgi:hypothetical protein